MKSCKALALMLVCFILAAALAGCGGGVKISYVLPEGAEGTAPKTVSYEPYEQFELPAADATQGNAQQTGWQDASGNFYANGSVFTVGSVDMVLTAVFQATEVATSFCENPGTMNFGGRLIGPTAANAIFYADGSWTADAEGIACFSHFEGTWTLSDSGELAMTLVEQDGVERNTAVEITDDGKTFTFTLTHPGDRGGMKYHVNHISRYEMISAYNEICGGTVALPEEPTFVVSFDAAAEDATGETASVSGKLGETPALPECGFIRDGYTFAGWSVDMTTYQPGDAFTIQGYDVTVSATWEANEPATESAQP